MQIVTISGLDGSGKSTQIQKLKEYLESQNKKVFYFHAIEFGLANRISGKKAGEAKSVTKAGFFKIILRRIFLMIDLLRFRFLLRKLRNEGFDFLISDRYFFDTAVNIKYLAKNNKKLPCERFILIPDKAIYLKTSPENIMQRERKPDQGIEYLQEKEDLYDEMAKEYNLKIVDGNRGKEEIFEEVKGFICGI